jgi:hypothetical protein
MFAKNFISSKKNLLITILVLLHLNPHVTILGGYFSGILVFLYCLSTFIFLDVKVSRGNVYFIFVFLMLVMLHIAITPDTSQLIEKFKGSVQIVLGMLVFFYLVSLKLFESSDISRPLLIFLVFILVFAMSEVSSEVFRALIEQVRSQFFPSDYLYESYERDVEIAGHVRPTLMAAEPSHLSKSIFILYGLILVWPLSRIILVFMTSMVGVFLYLLASPIIVGVFALMLFRVLNFRWFLLTLFLAGLSLSFANDWGNSMKRFETFGDLDVISSENIRFIFPAVLVKDVLLEYPMIGVGISNDVVLDDVSSLPYEVSYVSGNNSILKILHYTGLLGAMFFFGVLYFLSSQLRRSDSWYFVIFVFLFSFSTGAIFTIYFWTVIGLIYSALESRRSRCES